MLTRTSRIFCHPLDRSHHQVWLLLVLLVLPGVPVALVGLHHLVVHLLDTVLAIAMVVVAVPGQAMVLSILVVVQATMVQTEVMVDLHLDLEDTVEAMEEVDLVVTVVHLVVSIHQARTVTHRAVGILQDHRTVFHQVVPQVAIHLKVVPEITHPLDLVVHHTQDQVVLRTLDLVVPLILDLEDLPIPDQEVHLILDLVAHPIPDLAVLHILGLVVLHILGPVAHHFLDLEDYQDLVLQAKLVHLDLVVHHKPCNLVPLLQARTPHHPLHQQTVLPHHPQPQAQQILQIQAPTLLLHQITHLLLPPRNRDQQVPPPRILALQALPPLTTHPLILPMVVHLQAHTTTHQPQASLITQATPHIQLLATHLEDPHQATHLVVLHQVLVTVVVHHQATTLQAKVATRHTAIKEDLEATLVLLVDTHHIALPVAQVVQWVLLLPVDTLPTTKTDMVHHLDLEVLHHLKNSANPLRSQIEDETFCKTGYRIHCM